MEIIQSFNQNAVLAVDNDAREVILIGKGVGFGKKKGDSVNEQQISKVFHFDSSPQEHKIVELLKDVNEDLVLMAEDVATKSQFFIEDEMSPSFIIALASHIQFTLERNKENIVIPSPFQYEMKYIYPKEYEAAKWAVNYLNEEYQLALQKSEVIFFTLHFVNGLQETGEFSEVVKLSNILNDVTQLIDSSVVEPIDKEAIQYARFIVHVRYFIIRSMEKKVTKVKANVSELYKMSSSMFPIGSEIVTEINEMLKREYDMSYGIEEEFYLLLHITRLIDEGGNFQEA